MSRDQRYQRLLNSKQWKDLRRQYLQAYPLCQRCKEQGYVRAAVDLHHRVPVETGRTEAEMYRLCFDWDNLQALCIPCHVAVHKAMGKGTKANRKEREDERMSRWSERVRRTNPRAVDFIETTSESEISLPCPELRD